MQQQAWAREDNATQRRVEDLKAAGLSPTLAAGSAAQASAPVQTHAPQYSGASVQQKALDFLSQSQMRANIAQTQAQSALLDAQRKVIEHDYGVYSGVPGQTSTDRGTIPMAVRTINELLKKVQDSGFTFDLSKPAVSADYGEAKKSKGVSNDPILILKEKMQGDKIYYKLEKGVNSSKGGGGAGAWGENKSFASGGGGAGAW